MTRFNCRGCGRDCSRAYGTYEGYPYHFACLPTPEPAFVCPLCGFRSYNRNDAANRYCGRCHLFVDEVRA